MYLRLMSAALELHDQPIIRDSEYVRGQVELIADVVGMHKDAVMADLLLLEGVRDRAER